MTAKKKSLRKAIRKIRIFCEGGKTEPAYFAQLELALNTYPKLIKVECCGLQPKELLERAKNEQKIGLGDKGAWAKGDEVWLVFDRDSWAGLEDIFTKAEKFGFKIAFSKPRFELWLALHFKYTTSNSTSEHDKILKENVAGYHKSSIHLNTMAMRGIAEKYETACKNAVKLRNNNKREGMVDPLDCSAYTNLDQFIHTALRINLLNSAKHNRSSKNKR